MEEENEIYRATVINSPTGKNNPILKFKLENGKYIEKEYNYGPLNWGKGQTFYIRYNDNKIEIIDNYRHKNLYKLPFLLYIIFLIIIIFKIVHNISNNKEFMNFRTFDIFAVLALIPIILSCLIYYISENKIRKNSKQRTSGKIIAFIPIFKNRFQQGQGNRTYYEMEWRVLFEFKTWNGEIIRCIEDDKIFGGDRNVLINMFELNSKIPIRYYTENPTTAFINNDEYKFELRDFKGNGCKAKIVQIETVEMESLEKENIELLNCFKQDYLICEYEIDNKVYREKTQFPVNCGMFSVGDEIHIKYNVNNHREYNVSYIIWKN